MKHTFSFLKATMVSASVLMAGAAAQAEVALTHAEAGPNRGARANALQWFADQVTERSDGDISIDIQWGGALFKANAAATSIADGVSDLGTVIAVYFPSEMISYTIADLPLGNADAWVGMRATDELMRNNASIAANLADLGLVYIGTFTTSAVNIGCTEGNAIRSVSDIEGQRVRGVGAYGKVFADLGANLVPMSIYKAYQGIDSGLLDCSQGYSYAVAALKHQEVIANYTLLNWGQVGGLGIFMNKDAFDGLSAGQQAVLLETGDNMSDYFGEIIGGANERAIQTMRDAGVEIITLPEEERAILVEGGHQYAAAWVEKATAAGLDGAAILADYQALLASVAAGGTLGSLIPPSVLFIIYGIFTETSVSRLFMAGVLPGLLSLAGFLLVIYIWVKRDPSAAPADLEVTTLAHRLQAALAAWPAVLLFGIIIGGIYGGIFTATEAAAVCLSAAVVIGLLQRTLSLSDIWSALKETAVQTSAIFFIAAGAKIFVAFIALTRVAPMVTELVTNAELSVFMLMAVIALVYLLLGMFLDPIGIMVLTLPLIIPLVESYGLDLIWFGVVVVKLLEIGLITPPVGLNVFVIANVVGKEVPIGTIFAGIMRFLAVDMLVLILIMVFPIISLLLPNAM